MTTLEQKLADAEALVARLSQHLSTPKREADAEPEIAFGKNVRAARKSLGMTQEDLARLLDLAGHPTHQTTVFKMEKGTRPTSVGEVVALARILGTTAAALIGEVIA